MAGRGAELAIWITGFDATFEDRENFLIHAVEILISGRRWSQRKSRPSWQDAKISYCGRY